MFSGQSSECRPGPGSVPHGRGDPAGPVCLYITASGSGCSWMRNCCSISTSISIHPAESVRGQNGGTEGGGTHVLWAAHVRVDRLLQSFRTEHKIRLFMSSTCPCPVGGDNGGGHGAEPIGHE